MLDRHIRGEILTEKPLHPDQYAYSAGVSTETALCRVVQKLDRAINNKEIVLGAFLDIEGAFDNTSFNAIITAAKRHGINDTCCRWIESMLSSRIVHATLAGTTVSAQVNGGCPQGGVLSPLLWNLVVDDLLSLISGLGHRVVGYADDIAILIQGKFADTLRELMQEALGVVSRWTKNKGLKISSQKAVIVAFTKRRKLEGIGPLYLNNEELKFAEEVKYLGVTIDSKLSWNQHIIKSTKKAEITFMVIRRMFGKSWGLRPSMIYWLYTRVIRPSILYAALVWWPKVCQKTVIAQLGKIQRMACLAITGAIHTTPTTAMEVLLDLTPLDLLIKREARMALYRMQQFRQESWMNEGIFKIRKVVEEPILEMRSDSMISDIQFNKKFEVKIDSDYWNKEGNTLPEKALIWYTDGSSMEAGKGAGVHGERPAVEISLPLGNYATVFQTEVYAIICCVRENIRRAYANKQILIFSDSQAALGAIARPEVTSRLVSECKCLLGILSDQNKVQLVWVPGHRGVEGNEKADELARQGAASRFIGPEPALGISKCLARTATGDWATFQHNKAWKNAPGMRHGKLFIDGPCRKRAGELIRLNRHQLKAIVAVFTGHAPVRKHLATIGILQGDQNCRFCGQVPETVNHIVNDCEALARSRLSLLGKAFTDPNDIKASPMKDLASFIRKTGVMSWS